MRGNLHINVIYVVGGVAKLGYEAIDNEYRGRESGVGEMRMEEMSDRTATMKRCITTERRIRQREKK